KSQSCFKVFMRMVVFNGRCQVRRISLRRTEILKAHNIAWVQIDEPKFNTSIAAELPVTADFSYFRFHERNASTWWKGTTETRYQYLYSTEEIKELVEKVKTARKQTSSTFAFFNNHWK